MHLTSKLIKFIWIVIWVSPLVLIGWTLGSMISGFREGFMDGLGHTARSGRGSTSVRVNLGTIEFTTGG